MGEEYGENAPFLYFTSFEDPELGKAVSEGRKKEFSGHYWQGEAPDPQDENTFLRSRLNHNLRWDGQHRVLHEFYTELIRLRKTLPALRYLNKDNMNVIGYDREQVVFVHRWHRDNDVISVFNFNEQPVTLVLPMPRGRWQLALHSTDARWNPTPAAANVALSPDWDDVSSAELTLPPKSVTVFVKA